MLIENVVNAFWSLLTTLLNWIQIPQLPESISGAFDQFFSILNSATSFAGFVLPGSILTPVLVVFLVLYALDHGYPVVMWVLRKIPFVGIE